MTQTEINEADEVHQHVKQVFASIAQDENLTATQRDNAREVLARITSLEQSLDAMLARGERLPGEPDKGLLQ